MIPYYLKLKEDCNKYCPICSQRFKKKQTVLIYLHSSYAGHLNVRYAHRFCIIKYSLKMELNRHKSERR